MSFLGGAMFPRYYSSFPGRGVAWIGLLLFVFWPCTSAYSQDAINFFKQNCQGCHTIGGGQLVGPDLKNVSKRQERKWLLEFIQDPQAVIDSGDTYAAKLVRESGGKVMSRSPGMNKSMASALLNLIDSESLLKKSNFKGVQVSERPFVPEDVQAGRNLFLGKTPFSNGGAACNSCHTVNKLNLLYGGTLGPDLSRVFGRLGGRKSLSGWLVAPGSATMTPIYKDHALKSDEILSLVAFFKKCSEYGGEDQSASRANFTLLGLLGAGLLLGLFDYLWRNRFRGVRKNLVYGHDIGDSE
jgi:mono/diheme cytochrome c family protein